MTSQAAAATWEEELRPSRHAEGLPQLEQGLGRWGRQIPSDPALWRCDETGATDNLWLNLSTGFIGSGRQAGRLPPVLALKSKEEQGYLLACCWCKSGCKCSF